MFTLTPGTPIPHSVFLLMIVPALRPFPWATNTRNPPENFRKKKRECVKQRSWCHQGGGTA